MTFLGLDCGGTKTRTAWWPRGVHELGTGAAVQPASHGVEAASRALVERIRTADPRSEAEAIVAAIAGAGDATIRSELLRAVAAAGIATKVAIVGDTLAAAAAVLETGPGALVFAGTGSFAVVRAVDGTLHRTGGRGHLLGDQGSGYDLVRRAAAAVVLAVDDLGPPTALTEALCRAFAAPSPSRLGAVLQQKAQGEVAAALPIVLDCALRGDQAAGAVLEDGMEMLAMVCNAAVRTADLEWRGLPVHLGGGVLTGSDALRELLQARLRGFGAGPFALVPADAATLGAARLAFAWHQREQPMCRWVDDGAL